MAGYREECVEKLKEQDKRLKKTLANISNNMAERIPDSKEGNLIEKSLKTSMQTAIGYIENPENTGYDKVNQELEKYERLAKEEKSKKK